MKYQSNFLKLILLTPLLIITNCTKPETTIITKYKVVPVPKLDYNITTDYSKGKISLTRDGDNFITPVDDLNLFFKKYKYFKDMNIYKDSIIEEQSKLIDIHNNLKF